jgi:AcrR family transcriptional regulator
MASSQASEEPLVKQERSRRTRERVLDAAAAEFAVHGYLGANLQRVAVRTGLTKGAVYGHFGSKNEIAQALAQHLEHQVDIVIGQVQGAGGEDGTSGGLHQVHSLSLALASLVASDVRSGAALRLAVDEAFRDSVVPPVLDRVRVFARDVLPALTVLPGGARVPGPAVADLVLVLFLGAYCGTPALEGLRDILVDQVSAAWDLLLASPRPAGADSGTRG